MALVVNTKQNPASLTSGRTLAYGAAPVNVDTSLPLEASLIASGVLRVVDADVAPPLPSSTSTSVRAIVAYTDTPEPVVLDFTDPDLWSDQGGGVLAPKGVKYRGEWNGALGYDPDDLVTKNGTGFVNVASIAAVNLGQDSGAGLPAAITPKGRAVTGQQISGTITAADPLYDLGRVQVWEFTTGPTGDMHLSSSDIGSTFYMDVVRASDHALQGTRFGQFAGQINLAANTRYYLRIFNREAGVYGSYAVTITAPTTLDIATPAPSDDASHWRRLSSAQATRVVTGGNLGATPSLALVSSDAEVWLKGTLSANATLTLTGLSAGQKVVLLLTQNASAAKTLTVNDGSGAVAIPLSSAAQVLGARFVIECRYDGTDTLVKEV